jgi:tRNA pseudouridine38-40 synthase
VKRRLALLIEYDGNRYAGSQLQTNGPSIQAELEHAIEAMTGAFSRLAFASRTDAGVHAAGQVATFDTEAPYTGEAFRGGLNARLPSDIAVQAVRDVSASFDPRREAIGRRYRYTVVNSAVPAPLLRQRSWWVKPPLNEPLMGEATALLLGEHDFAAFAPPEASRLSTRREVRAAALRRCDRALVFEIEANAFVMHQVRRTIAAIVAVGSGKVSISEFAQHLQEARPGAFEQTAPPYGLCLLEVTYEPPLWGGAVRSREKSN